MIFEIIRGGGGGGGKLPGWGKNGPAYFFPGERMGRPILSPGKKLTGGKFRPVTPGIVANVTIYEYCTVAVSLSRLVLRQSFMQHGSFIFESYTDLFSIKTECTRDQSIYCKSKLSYST